MKTIEEIKEKIQSLKKDLKLIAEVQINQPDPNTMKNLRELADIICKEKLILEWVLDEKPIK